MSVSCKVFSILITVVGFKASALCLGEAQVIAPIISTQTDRLHSCRVYIDLSKVRVYNESMVCPLDINEVVTNGVEVGLKADLSCRLLIGDELNGIIVKTKKNSIIWEDAFPGYDQ